MKLLFCLLNLYKGETQAENEKKAKALLEGFSCVSFGATVTLKIDQLYMYGMKFYETFLRFL